MSNSIRFKLALLTLASLLGIAIFLFGQLVGSWDYVFPRRVVKVTAIVITAGAIAFSTLVFQTITNNRILTPSIIGLDSLYVLFQTFIVFLFGSTSRFVVQQELNFLLSTCLMLLFVFILYRMLFKREGRHLYFLLLVGLVMGTLFNSLSTFMQVLIDPNEFLTIQSRMFASFNHMNTDLVLLSLVVILICLLYGASMLRVLDVMALGREHALNLGIAYDRTVRRLLVLVALLVSVSTSLVGPITFLGLLVVNVTYQLMGSHKHKVLLPGAFLISIVTLLGGQLLVERVFSFTTTVSVIVNFAGGVYFLYLLLRENKL